MSPLSHGQIVWAEMKDSQGRNPKVRPAVVILSSDATPADTSVWLVGISTNLDAARSSDQVILPSDPKKHPTTGFIKESAAVCTWMEKVPLSKIGPVAGKVPGRELIAI